MYTRAVLELTLSGCPLCFYSHRFRFSSKKGPEEKGNYYVWQVSDAGPVEDWKSYLQMAKALSAERITPDTEYDVEERRVEPRTVDTPIPF